MFNIYFVFELTLIYIEDINNHYLRTTEKKVYLLTILLSLVKLYVNKILLTVKLYVYVFKNSFQLNLNWIVGIFDIFKIPFSNHYCLSLEFTLFT